MSRVFGVTLPGFHYEQQWDRLYRVTPNGYLLYGPLRPDGGW